MITRLTRCAALVATLCLAGCSSVYMKGTPLYRGAGKGAPEDRVNVWPLVYYHRPALSILWPMMDWTDDHWAVRPLVSAYKLDKEKPQWNMLAPLAQFDFDKGEHRVVPVFWGGDYFVAFPLVWWFDKTKGVFPAFWQDDAFVVAPLFWYKKDKHCLLFPLWLHNKEDEGRDTHVLWPLLRWKDTKDESGFHVWPLFGSYQGKQDNADERYRFALWPLVHDYHDTNETFRIAFPLFCQYQEKGDGWWVLAPFAYRGHKGADALTLTPLWSAGNTGEARWSALLPLYYQSANAAKKTRRVLTPLVGWSESPDKRRWTAVPLLSSIAWGRGEKDVWVLGPLAHARWGGDNVQHHALPFYYYDRNRKLFLSPLVSRQSKKREGFLNLLMLLAHYSHKKDGEKEFQFLLPLTSVRWGARDGSSGTRLFPLFARDKSVFDRPEIVRPKYKRGAMKGWRKTLTIFPWMAFTRGEHTTQPLKGSGGRTTRHEQHDCSLWPLWSNTSANVTSTAADQKAEGKQSFRKRDFSLLGWLYDYELREGKMARGKPKSGTRHVRQRVLVGLVHDERFGDDRSLDVFPFITWDSKADGYRKASFLWRLYRNERTADGGRKLDLLFIPLLRRQGKPESR